MEKAEGYLCFLVGDEVGFFYGTFLMHLKQLLIFLHLISRKLRQFICTCAATSL